MVQLQSPCANLISCVKIKIMIVISKTLVGININESSQHPFELGDKHYYDKYTSEN